MTANNKPASALNWESFRNIADGIWEREYYTNHGPLVVKLESKIQETLGVKHAVCMTNSSIALMISIKALDVSGSAIIPSFSHPTIAQSVFWAGLEPAYADVKPDTLTIDPELISNVRRADSKLIIAVNLFGQPCDVNVLETLSAKYNCRLAFISDSLLGERFKGKLFGNFGDLEIFSFHDSRLINGGDGSCVCTNNDLIAAKLRNIRSSYGAGPAVPIPYTGNGRMSEIQAGLILNSLGNFESLKIDFIRKLTFLQDVIDKIDGVSLFGSSQKESTIGHDLILEFDDLFEEKAITDLFTRMRQVNRNIVQYKLFGRAVKPPYGVAQKFSNNRNFIKKAIGIPPGISFDLLINICELLRSLQR